MDFEIIGNIEAIETIAVGSKIRVLAYLQKVHGFAVWNFTGTKLMELDEKT